MLAGFAVGVAVLARFALVGAVLAGFAITEVVVAGWPEKEKPPMRDGCECAIAAAAEKPAD